MPMQITHATNDTCGDATGAVIASDVLRAFTTAAFAFAAGARDILLVSTVAEALALRARFPGSFVMGEVDGLPVAGQLSPNRNARDGVVIARRASVTRFATKPVVAIEHGRKQRARIERQLVSTFRRPQGPTRVVRRSRAD